MNLLKNFKKELHLLADSNKAISLQRFFKTGKGEYGEGDKFLGITVPNQRKLINNYLAMPLADVEILLNSAWHEERLSALLLLIKKYQKAESSKLQQELYKFYLNHTQAINNWDLVDLSAPHIVGNYLFGKTDKEKAILYSLAQKPNLWLRRIAIVATFYFIKNNHYQKTLLLAKELLSDKEDLIHKATGWMLREVGKRDEIVLEKFLKQYRQKMPRTMLRYAIERFSEQKRKKYLL